MSFWDNLKKFAQPYGDDEFDDYEEEEGLDTYEEEVEEERPARRRSSFFNVNTNEDTDYKSTASTTATANTGRTGFSGQVVSLGNRQEVVLFHPSTFNDTSKAADDLRNKKAVILNMENVDKAMARRVVDFLSGCAYAVDGKVKKVAQSTYLFCPHNMDVVGDLENLQAEVESYI
ncbi:MAG: cell division protein SepF [Oscillospiraceae bacterium]|nr:cell division protein SepF [Oscillospiraceae bacterium]